MITLDFEDELTTKGSLRACSFQTNETATRSWISTCHQFCAVNADFLTTPTFGQAPVGPAAVIRSSCDHFLWLPPPSIDTCKQSASSHRLCRRPNTGRQGKRDGCNTLEQYGTGTRDLLERKPCSHCMLHALHVQLRGYNVRVPNKQSWTYFLLNVSVVMVAGLERYGRKN